MLSNLNCANLPLIDNFLTTSLLREVNITHCSTVFSRTCRAKNREMSLPDLMDFTTAQRPPSTPSKDSGFESDSPPPLLHSPASVKSLGSPRHGSLADLSHPRDDPRGQGLEYTPSKASTHALDGLASITTPTRKPMEIQLPELEPERPLSYPKSSNADDSTSLPTLSYIALGSQKARNPPIKVLLVLSPNPAFTRELSMLDGVFRQFCADFSKSSDATAEATKKQQKMDKWTHISLYTHWRTHGADPLHGIHHYALQAKLEREDEVQWRLGLPVLEKLIEEEVRRGDDRRAFVVSGLKAGDLEGVRAFAERVSRLPFIIPSSSLFN